MIPKTKHQKKVMALDAKLPPLTNAQKVYGYKHCLPHKATLLKSGKLSCLDCGHQWQSKHNTADKVLGVTCPNCQTKLEVEQTRKKTFFYESYYSVISNFKGFQIIRMCTVRGTYKAGQKADFGARELFRNWIAPNGKIENVGLYTTSYFYDTWGGDWELRNKNSTTNYNFGSQVIYPRYTLIKELKRNGIKKNLQAYNLQLLTLFTVLLEPHLETLFKANKSAFINYYERNGIHKINKYWNSIKISMRNKYQIKDVSLWFDYLDLLKYFNKDLRSPKYVCPADFKKEHNRLMLKKRAILKKEALIKKRKQVQKQEKEYKRLKHQFFGLTFSKNLIEINVLESVKEFIEEGDALHHCLYDNDYHEEANSLIFSARLNGKRLATIEVGLENFNVLQIRGYDNLPTDYDKEIKNIVMENMHLIKVKAFGKEQIAA
tara:strand:+ start:232 stop:1530 length:1299 start_codon:yes stop_codon:yes gene_type:complete